jgi:hypothetical protein
MDRAVAKMSSCPWPPTDIVFWWLTAVRIEVLRRGRRRDGRKSQGPKGLPGGHRHRRTSGSRVAAMAPRARAGGNHQQQEGEGGDEGHGCGSRAQRDTANGSSDDAETSQARVI